MSREYRRDTQSIADELKRVLPERLHPDIPTLARILAAAREASASSVATESLFDALKILSGQTLNIQGDTITVGNITGEGIAIGCGAQATVIRIYVPRTPDQKEEWRIRSRMLKRVRTTWIEGFLQKSLHMAALIDVGMQYQQHALNDPRNMYLHRFGEPDQLVPPGTSIASIFDSVANELLILGAPGTGKTTMLLELTRILIERAEQDENLPIPVVFTLSSWAVKRLPLAQWLVEELKNIYSLRSEIGKKWIRNNYILPLLDGLDEVPLDARNACVDAINTFRNEHGLSGIVVCSRSKDYELLTRKLHLSGAVLLRPLTRTQVDNYFKQLTIDTTMIQDYYKHLWDSATIKRNDQDGNRREEGIREQELLCTPLMLHIITIAYAQDPTKIDQTHSLMRLFGYYADRMLRPRPGSLPGAHYPLEQTRDLLSWLASKMLEKNHTIFRIEQISKDWLRNEEQKRIYGTIIGCITALYVGSLICISTWIIWGPVGGLLAGIVTGVTLGLAFGLDSWRRGTIETVETVTWQWERIKSAQETFMLYVTFIGIIAVLLGMLVGVSIGLFQGIVTGSITAIGLLIPLISLMGLSGESLPRTSYPNERIWRSLRTFITVVAGCTLGLGTTMACVSGGLGWLLTDPEAVQASSNAQFTGASGGLLIDLVRALQPRFTFIVQNAGTGALAGLLLGVSIGAIMGSFIGAICGLLLGGLFYGGLPCLQHSIIRLLLYRYNFIPWNYARFLDYTVDRILLHKVGGGYIFVHRLLMEYFASLTARDRSAGVQQSWHNYNSE